MRKNAFIFVVCGSRHVVRLGTAIRFLRKFSSRPVFVVSSSRISVDCDQLITAPVPKHFDDHRASIFLKTSLHRLVAGSGRTFCYLDSDVMAVDKGVDRIFEQFRAPISFAPDHCDFREFGRFAVNCPCRKSGCTHLHEAIRKKFGVSINDPAWRHWNGGLFVFNQKSEQFMEHWHQKTVAIFTDPYWKTRDQGTLAATVWELGLQNQSTLPVEFNFVVDPLKNIRKTRSQAGKLKGSSIPADESYTLGTASQGRPKPKLLHFINDGIGKRGWKNWDDVELLLENRPAPASPVAPGLLRLEKKAGPQNSGGLSPDNRIVHGLWIGPALSKMELLTIHSFLKHGHEFHLWLYDDLNTPLPKGVIIEDANEIIPENRIIRKAEVDPESGVGKGSVSSPFSDLFRYKLLYEKGGYWVDMDVTCLQPFNFDAPYLFRAHAVGVVGNIMKCPPRSKLMKDLYEKVAKEVSPHSPWMMPNRMLSAMVNRLGLAQYIRRDIWNEESWWDVIRPLMSGTQSITPGWVAIHWINEFLRTLKENGGFYRGRRLLETVPDKDNPSPGSALAALYSNILPAATTRPPVVTPPVVVPVKNFPPPPVEQPARRQPPAVRYTTPGHMNIVIESLARGGAERIVLETISSLLSRNVSIKLFVMHEAAASFPLPTAPNLEVFRLGKLELPLRIQKIVAEVTASPQPVVYTHLLPAEKLKLLWERGIMTIPVIHNSREGWQSPADAFNDPHVPMVIAVAAEVAKQLCESGCHRPVVVLRHQLQRWFTVDEQQRNRLEIRGRYGITDGTLLIGMVGEFKSQKAYTRAIRVLAQLRQRVAAKLMILGGWDHEWGHGRHAYTAAMRLALDLGVITDVLTPGPMPDVEKYYAAFDVFLNTSAYEGLSISILEAINAGCPIVAADVGGNKEVLPSRAVLVKDPADTSSYVAGISRAIQTNSRNTVQKPADSHLTPKLWQWMSKYGWVDESAPLPTRSGVLFLTDNLNTGGTQRSLINLLVNFSPSAKAWLGVMEGTHGHGGLEELERHGVTVFSTYDAGDYLERVERILCMIDFLKARHVCFWQLDPRVKLLLAKILPPAAVRLTDVSPGPGLLMEMYGVTTFQNRIAFSTSDYWNRLDNFVAKYHGGIPQNFPKETGKAVIIPNGIPSAPSPNMILAPLPVGLNPDLIIGAVCRIHPCKRIDLLIEMMAELNKRLSGVTLIIVGGIDPKNVDYWQRLQARMNSLPVTNVRFVGPQHDVMPYLRHFKVLVTMPETAGCPNATLEAMSVGIPVVSNATGGIGEQVLHGISGFLSNDNSPQEMARFVRYLLVNPAARKRFGDAAKITASKDFSMNHMVQRYAKLFECQGTPGAPAKSNFQNPKSSANNKRRVRSPRP
jgi:glycosyltransferase involved in cell wall biosynthesis